MTPPASGLFIAASILQVVLMVGAPVAAALLLRRRWGLGGGLLGAGALGFVASQVVHLPLNLGLTALGAVRGVPAIPRPWLLPTNAVVLGLSAALCEELARYAVLRAWKKRARTFREAVVLGVGHGGIESVLLGAGVAMTLVNMGIARGLPADALGLSPRDAQDAVRTIAAYWRTPAWMPLLAAFERLTAMLFHVSAACLVMRAVREHRRAFLGAAILWHAVTDGLVVVYVGTRWGVVAAEAGLAAGALVSAAIVASTLRAMRAAGAEAPARAPRPTAPPHPRGAPVEVLGVTKQFSRTVRALDDATFTIEPGERVCLLGPNGAGKTTMIRLVTGGLEPTAGLVRLFGLEARQRDFLQAKRRVGIVPQSPGMYRDLRVGQYLELVRALYGRGDVGAIAGEVGLTESLDRPMAELSGGQQRRISIAAALLPRPELLLLDEPTVGLDPVAARDVRALLHEVMQGRTTLLCTHNLAEAEDTCDSVVILRAGRVVLHEPIAALRGRFTPEVVLGAREGPARLAEVLARLGRTPRAQPDGLVGIAVAAPETEVPALLAELLQAGLGIYECHTIQPTLEDLFFAAMGDRDVARA